MPSSAGEPVTHAVAAVVVAAGSGSRLGASVPKALVPVAGEPLVAHAVRRLLQGGVDVVVVVAPSAHLEAVKDAVGGQVAVVVGGASRQASVAAGLAAVPATADVVLVHDAARCFAPPELVARVVAAVRSGHRAVIPVGPVADTLVTASEDAPVARYEDRSRMRTVQTPQGFDRATLDRAHAAGVHRAAAESLAATDDASLVAALGEQVWAVAGDDAAMKITTPRDLALAEGLNR